MRRFTQAFKVVVAAAGVMFGLTSCLQTGDGDDHCKKDFEKVIDIVDIRGGSHLHIPIAMLDFLFAKGGLVITDADLQVDYVGKKKVDEKIDLSLNGIKITRGDGKRSCESLRADEKSDSSEAHYKMHKFSLNGGQPFDLFLLKLKASHGSLVISLKGKNTQIQSAKLVFKGKRLLCPEEPPPPPPQPKPAATTVINSITPAQSPTNSTGISLSFHADQTGVTFWCSIDGSAFAKCSSPQTYAGLVSGSHGFRVYSQNSSGVNESPGASYQWSVDTEAPTVEITNKTTLSTRTSATSVNFEFASNEAASFQCRLDEGEIASCQSPMIYSGLSDGSHTFAVQAIDAVGNTSGSADTFTWIVDTTAPETLIVSVKPFATISNISHRLIEFAANESGDFECSFDNGPFAPCLSPVNLTGLNESSHYFEVRARDLTGNVGGTVSVAWKNDYTLPTLILGNVLPVPGLIGSTDIRVDFSSDEAAVFVCSKDGAPVEACETPILWSNLSDGKHTASIAAIDLAGNQSPATTLEWIVDTTAPVLSFASITPSSAQYVNASEMSFLLNSTEVSQLTMSLNGQALAAANPLQLSALTDGPYTLKIVARDGAGNTSSELVHHFTVDTKAPTLSLVSDDAKDPTNLDLRTWTFVSDEPVTYECNIDSQGFSACVSPLELSGLADGRHELIARARDSAGNQTTATAAWTIDSKAPTTQLSGVQNNSDLTFNFTADESATFACALDGEAFSSCVSPVVLAGVSPGNHTFVVQATDAAGNREPAGASFSFLVQLPISTAITALNPSVSPTNQTTASFTFAANQPTSAFLCSLDGSAFVACASPVNFTGLADGNHQFIVKAVDLWGSVDSVGASASWSVDSSPPIVNGLSTTATTNSITVSWTTSEASSHQVRYGIGLTINNQTVETSTLSNSHSVTLTDLTPNTTYSVQVYGRDAAGNSYLSSSRSVRTAR